MVLFGIVTARMEFMYMKLDGLLKSVQIRCT